MSNDSIHDAVLCAERRGRTSARSIDAATVKEPAYGCDCRLANGIYRHNSPHHLDHPRLVDAILNHCGWNRAFRRRSKDRPVRAIQEAAVRSGFHRMSESERERFEAGFADSSLNVLAARAIAMETATASLCLLSSRPVTRSAPATRLRLAQPACSRSLPSRAISSERAVPF
jgi:hypothetical protein